VRAPNTPESAPPLSSAVAGGVLMSATPELRSEAAAMPPPRQLSIMNAGASRSVAPPVQARDENGDLWVRTLATNGVRPGLPYWFNVRTRESSWTAPNEVLRIARRQQHDAIASSPPFELFGRFSGALREFV